MLTLCLYRDDTTNVVLISHLSRTYHALILALYTIGIIYVVYNTACSPFFLPKKDRRDGKSGNDSGQIRQQTTGYRVARIFDIHRPEIDSEDIKRGVRSPLQDAAESSDEAVSSIGGHRLKHQPACTTTGERFHEGGWHSSRQVRIDATGSETPGYTLFQQPHRTARAEHSDSHQDGYQIRDNTYRRLETAFRAIDKRLIYVDMLAHGLQDKPCNHR